MKIAIISHKPCWRSREAPSGYSTDGGFPFQIAALSGLFQSTVVLVPVEDELRARGGTPLHGHALSVAPLTPVPGGSSRARKILFPLWLARNSRTLVREVWRADGVHAPVPGDVGTIGILVAWLLRRPLFVRYCGNWKLTRSGVDRSVKRLLEALAGGRNVVLATGGDGAAPSARNDAIHWIFATSLTEEQLRRLARVREAPKERVQLIVVCRQEPGKGVDLVLRSISLLAARLPGVLLDVVGDGSALGTYRELAARLKVEERVTFHGALPHDAVLERLQKADLFCYPTASEGFPKVVVEAMASGLPLIASRVSVLPTLIDRGCGILLDERSPEAVAAAVLDCLADEERYRRMSQAALRVASELSLEAWARQIQEELESAWGSWPRPAEAQARTS